MTVKPDFTDEELKLIEQCMFFSQMNAPHLNDRGEEIHKLRQKIEKVIEINK